MITYSSIDVDIPKFYRNTISKWIREVAQGEGKKVGDISYIFCSDDKILEINNQYLQHDYFTDIITFDYSKRKTISGDIFISLDTVVRNAKEYRVSFDAELKRVMIHGILHLCGQNDSSTEEQQQMRAKEDDALRLI